MEKIIDILTFKTAKVNIGIDCNEIIQMITNKMIIAGFIDYDNEDYRFFKIGDMWNTQEEIIYETLLLIKGENNKNFSLYIPSTLDVIKAPVEKIILMPEFVRNRQEPLFNWGFIDTEEGMVSLITFNYYKEKK